MRTWVAPLAIAALIVSACGSDEAEGPRPVTDDEAARMAETLFNDYDLGGADFELNGRLPDGTTVRLAGEIDWRAHAGRADVRVSDGPDAAVTEVYWTEQVVIERIPTLAELAPQVGRAATELWARPPAVEQRHLDSMIQLLTSLAAEQRDNAVLIAQTPGTAWLRSDVAPGTDTPVDVLRYGDRTIYWLAEGGVTLLRFEGNNRDGNRPVVVDLSGHGGRDIELPDPTMVADSLVDAELYEIAIGVPPG